MAALRVSAVRKTILTMREFFVLIHDDRDDLAVVSDYEMGEFDLMSLWTGERMTSSIPADVRVWVENGEPTDYMGNPISWQIVSDRLWSIIQPLVGNDCQVLEAPLYDEKSRMPISGYVLLNPTRCVPAAKKVASISDLHLDIAQIPGELNSFRLKESSTVVLVSDALVQAVSHKNLKGLAFLRTKTA